MQAQTNPDFHAANSPSVGLCLSGGGAKGLAHISLLKALDSLGIRVDYITGTSMGSIVGGLYAIGYSGNELDKLVRGLKWNTLLSNNVPLDHVNADEKDEHGRYPLELPVKGRRVELPSGIIEGQELTAVLQALTFRVAHIRDFDNLPIPFKCIGADIVSGKPLILDKGNLAMALRTSMSIPTIFTPIEHGDSLLLVDGGLSKNFPVDIVRDMGAKLVIGGYTGGKLYEKEELNSLVKIMYQSANFSRIAESEVQKTNCDVLADFNNELDAAGITASDFKKVEAILAIGDQVVMKIMPQLQALARAQRANRDPATDVFGWRKKVAGLNSAGIPVCNIVVNGLDSFISPQMLMLSAAEADSIVSEYFGTRRFKTVYYDFNTSPDDGEPSLNIQTRRQPRTVLKGGLHYDTELAASLIANLTLRDLLGSDSRAVLGVDIGDNYKVRADYHKHLRHSRWWANGYGYFEKITAPVYLNNMVFDDFHRRFLRVGIGLNHTLSQSSYFGVHFVLEQTGYRPRIRVDQRSLPFVEGDTLIGVSKVRYHVPGVEFRYSANTLDHTLFPTRGKRIAFNTRISLGTSVLFATQMASNNRILREDERSDLVHPYAKVFVRWEKVYFLKKRLRLYPKFYAGARFTDREQEVQLDVMDRFFVGGADWRNDWAFVPFWGNRDGFALHSAFVSAQVGMPLLVSKNFQIVPQYSLLAGTGLVSNNSSPILDIGQEMYQSFGVMFGLNTLVGPMMLNIAKADNDKAWRVYGSIGFRF